jgi:hypothetical protein
LRSNWIRKNRRIPCSVSLSLLIGLLKSSGIIRGIRLFILAWDNFNVVNIVFSRIIHTLLEAGVTPEFNQCQSPQAVIIAPTRELAIQINVRFPVFSSV